MQKKSHHYDDILECERPPSGHPRMPRKARAAQFSPFAALQGLDETMGMMRGSHTVRDEQRVAEHTAGPVWEEN